MKLRISAWTDAAGILLHYEAKVTIHVVKSVKELEMAHYPGQLQKFWASELLRELKREVSEMDGFEIVERIVKDG